MWPFNSRRIFASRWWALSFVVFVCWQVAEMFEQPSPQRPNAVAAAEQGGEQIDEAQLQAITQSLNDMQRAE